MSRNRKCSGMTSNMLLEKWTRRIKLHSQWREERESVSVMKEEQSVMDALLGFTELESNSKGQGGEGNNRHMGKSDEQSGIEEASRGRSDDEDRIKGQGDDEGRSRGQGGYGKGDYEAFLTRLKAIWSKDPYVLEEYLQLGFEEAFYLVNEAQVLVLITMSGEELAPKTLWMHFSEHDSSFPVKYAAYRHYRVGNWVPKSGLKFGVDFLLYKESPLLYHSSFAVVVRERNVSGGSSFKWEEVITMNRVCEAAKKDLLVCDVTRPSACQVDEGVLRDPTSVHLMAVTNTVVKRWIPKRDRK